MSVYPLEGKSGIAPQKQSAFTLIELMVAIAVLAIVITIAIPAFNNLLSSNRLSGQANEVLAGLALARTEAIKQNQEMVFCHSTNGTTCSAAPASGWQGWLVARSTILGGAGVEIQATGILSGQLTILANAAIASASDAIRFNTQGMLRDANGALLNGVIRVCQNTAANPNSRDVLLRSGGRIWTQRTHIAGCTRPANP